MPAFSRRLFIRNASIGAVATGAAAAGGLGAFTALAGNASATTGVPLSASTDTPTLEGSGVMAHVVDAKTGQMTLFVGTKEISFTNRDVAQQLLRAAQ